LESKLGTRSLFRYAAAVIGFMRFVGVLNAAVWLGAAIFYTIATGPAMESADMQRLVGANSFSYFSTAIGQILMARMFRFHAACGAIALLHLAAERLYLGRPARKFWLGLLAGLFVLGLAGSVWICPSLDRFNQAQYAVNYRAEQRQAAAKSFRLWHGVVQAINVLIIGGLGVYLWRVTNPTDAPRFVSAIKFRG
jgi:hypothetical protein